MYHYLGGVITGLLGDYARAADLLEIVSCGLAGWRRWRVLTDRKSVV